MDSKPADVNASGSRDPAIDINNDGSLIPKALARVLSAFGEPSKKALLQKIIDSGISLKQDERCNYTCVISGIEKVMEGLIGSGARIVTLMLSAELQSSGIDIRGSISDSSSENSKGRAADAG